MQTARRHIGRLARNAAKDFGLGWKVPRAYRVAASAPVDPRKVLFVEATRTQLPDAFKVMFGRLEADPRFSPAFISLGKYRLPAAGYLRNCVAFAREAATARAIFLCDASDVVSCFPLRPETDVVQLWHACGAFKRFGLSTADAPYGLSRADIERHPFYGNLSLVTVSSPDVAWAYVEAMGLAGREGVVEALGVSRTDVFFSERFHERALRRVFQEVPAALGKRVVLYAPTLRGTMDRPEAPALPDLPALKRAIGHDSVLLVKQHPAVRSRPRIPPDCAGFAFDVSERLDIDELLVAADVLVTDYSSVVFEFSLFGRPMLFYAPDLEEYLAERDFYYPYADMAPGPVLSTSDELASCLSRIGPVFDGARVRDFRRRFMGACDGRATERIIARVFS